MKHIWFFGIVLNVNIIKGLDLEIDLPYGTIRGREAVTPSNKIFRAFQGIPYAAPPVGPLRFQAPQPPSSWTGIKYTVKDSNICYSVTEDTADENEDCLYINVYTPVLSKSTSLKLPVMLWIYGGAYRSGSDKYDFVGPDYFIEKDVIIVAFNYRLGPFGFLATEDGVVYGNAGLKDQAAAIKWVHEHISLFGGDKEKITIFGHSAGAASVGYQLLYKRNQGLFRGAILQSGCPLNQFSFMGDASSRANAFDLASKINENIDFQNDTEMLLNFLMNVPAREIDKASTKTTEKSLPVIEPEHEGAFITRESYELLELGEFINVPIMIGTKSEEAIGIAKDPSSLNKTLVKYESIHELFIPSKGFHVKNGVKKSTVGNEIFKVYLSDTSSEDKLGHFVKYRSDNEYSKPVIKYAELASKSADVYFYLFSYDGPMGNISVTVPGAGRVGHGEDERYMWMMNSSTYSNTDLSRFPKSDVLTHKRMIQLWTNFAKYLNPTPEPTNLLQNVTWPKVQSNNFLYLNIGCDLTIHQNPKSPFYEAWNKIYNDWNQRPFTVF